MWSDFLVVGGGIAGASVGYFLSDYNKRSPVNPGRSLKKRALP
jgi:L-2-hydroxyglutarate oxidase LhgO